MLNTASDESKGARSVDATPLSCGRAVADQVSLRDATDRGAATFLQGGILARERPVAADSDPVRRPTSGGNYAAGRTRLKPKASAHVWVAPAIQVPGQQVNGTPGVRSVGDWR